MTSQLQTGKEETKLKIGIDAHYLDGFSQGVKTVLYNLLSEFENIEKPYQYFLYHKNAAKDLKKTGNNQRMYQRPILTNAGELNLLFGFPYYSLKDKLDLIHCQYICPIWCSCPVVVTIYDILFESLPQFFGKRHSTLLKLLVPLSARKAKHIITISEYSRNEIIKRYNVSPEKITSIPLGVNEAFIPQNMNEVDQTLATLKIKKPYILYVGRIAPIKNISGLLGAFSYLISKNVDINLVIVGGKDNLFKETESLNILNKMGKIQSRVHFTGEVTENELVSLYNGAELFVFPSFGEGFGLPVLEAMACGTAVLCSDKTAIPEVLGSAGMTFNPYNQDEFNEKILFLLTNKVMRKEFSVKGLQRASYFSWNSVARNTIELYEKIIL